jgi:hypothetical protein
MINNFKQFQQQKIKLKTEWKTEKSMKNAIRKEIGEKNFSKLNLCDIIIIVI